MPFVINTRSRNNDFRLEEQDSGRQHKISGSTHMFPATLQQRLLATEKSKFGVFVMNKPNFVFNLHQAPKLRHRVPKSSVTPLTSAEADRTTSAARDARLTFSSGSVVAVSHDLSSRILVQRGKRMEMPSAVWWLELLNSAPVISHTTDFCSGQEVA